ncbi:hypothetical protein [Bacillus mycoides]|uniref:hypothetical protein n=1 Tax=Bacillus mycoides TaxID=1405 RepID=UPI003D656287
MVRPYTHWAVWNTEDGKKVFADNFGTIMDRETAYKTMCSIVDFYESISDVEIAEFNKQLKKDQHDDLKKREELREKKREHEKKYKPTYMFIIKKVNEPCYKFKFGGHRVFDHNRKRKLNTIQEQLDFRLDNLEKESEIPIELEESFIYVHNAQGIYSHILDKFRSFRDEFDWYVLEDESLVEIIDYIKANMLEV